MAFFSTLTRLGAAAAMAFAVMGPVALADDRGKGDRGGFHDRGDRGHRGDRGRDNRGDRGHDRGRDHRGDRGHDRGRDWDKGRDRGRDWGHNNNRGRDWNDRNRRIDRKVGIFDNRYRHHNNYRPRTVHRYYHSTPSYAYPRYRPRVTFHYNHGYHHNGYRIGSYYSYRPNTIIIRDYGMYGLYAPPAGHHWVRDPYGDDAVLASIATGAIIGLAVGILAN